MSSEQVNNANKGTAEDCRDRGSSMLRSGDYAGALKMLDKSLRLFPLPGVDKLRDQALNGLKAQQRQSSSANQNDSNRYSGNGASSGRSTTNGTSSNSNSSSSTSSKAPGEGTRKFTPEQEAGSKKIMQLSKKSHYEVLGVGRNAGANEIKKAYRKLQVKYHPDKNSAPTAEAACKAINTAYDVLTDPEKKSVYDQVGHENAEQAMNNGGGGGGGFPGGFGGGGFGGFPGGGGMRFSSTGDISPEDLFNLFFNGQAGGFRTQRGGGGHRSSRSEYFRHNDRGSRGQHTHSRQSSSRGSGNTDEEGGGKSTLFNLFQLLPILCFFLMSLSSWGTETHRLPYSISKTQYHPVRIETNLGGTMPGIPYYVTHDLYNLRNKGRLSKMDAFEIEKNVGKEYWQTLQTDCSKEKQRNAVSTIIYILTFVRVLIFIRILILMVALQVSHDFIDSSYLGTNNFSRSIRLSVFCTHHVYITAFHEQESPQKR